MTKIAVIGCGHWGKNHINTAASLDILGAVCDSDSDRANQFAAAHNVHALSYDEVLASNIEGLVIALPAHLHYDFARRALEADKAVLVEKPITLDLSEAEALIELADKHSQILMVGHVLRYHAAFQAVHKLLGEGRLGKVLYIASDRHSHGIYRTEENALWSLAPHDVSMILGLMGEEPTGLTYHGTSRLMPGVDDYSHLHMSFPSGAAAHIDCSWMMPVKRQSLSVIGDKAMAVFDDRAPAERKLMVYNACSDISGATPVAVKDMDGEAVELESGSPLERELQAFVTAINTSTPPPTDGREALAVLKVLKAACAPTQRA